MKHLISVLALLFLNHSFACTLIPENNLRIPVSASLLAGGLSEASFISVIDKVSTIYSPIFSAQKLKLTVKRLWSDSTVNAMAGFGSTDNDVERMIYMYGGLARLSTMTEDTFVIVMCHEVGHHLGGTPYKVANGLSAEAESDYFATLKCARRVFLHDDNQAVVAKLPVPTSLKTGCTAAHPDKNDQAICIRSGVAASVLGDFFAGLATPVQSAPKFETPDSSVIRLTNVSYPIAQCRLDTFYQGALCEKSFNEDLSFKDEVKGSCHSSLGDTVGVRPLCWFHPSK